MVPAYKLKLELIGCARLVQCNTQPSVFFKLSLYLSAKFACKEIVFDHSSRMALVVVTAHDTNGVHFNCKTDVARLQVGLKM